MRRAAHSLRRSAHGTIGKRVFRARRRPGGRFALPGRWVPHLSLARGVRDEQLPAVLGLLATTPPYAATAVRLRRWDQDRREAWDVRQASTGRSL